MTKELSAVLSRLRNCLLYRRSIELSINEIRLLMKYINELEIEISGGNEED